VVPCSASNGPAFGVERLSRLRLMSSPSPVPWGEFTADPRRREAAPLRASDHDRDVVLGVLGEAFADGRLTREEYDERSATTAGARTLGELPPIIADLVPLNPSRSTVATSDELDRQAVRRWEHQRREAINGFLFIAIICWTIWAVTGANFPWPIFPTLFVGLRIPQVLMNKKDIVARERERLERKQRKSIEGRRRSHDDGEDA
jgi:hypothetical protein